MVVREVGSPLVTPALAAIFMTSGPTCRRACQRSAAACGGSLSMWLVRQERKEGKLGSTSTVTKALAGGEGTTGKMKMLRRQEKGMMVPLERVSVGEAPKATVVPRLSS